MVDANVPDIALEPDKTVKKVGYVISEANNTLVNKPLLSNLNTSAENG